MSQSTVKVPHQLTANTKLLHKVALWHRDKVLILKRNPSSVSRPGMWDLAGGNSEWPKNKPSGHSLHKADIAREIVEETGVKIDQNKFTTKSLVFFDTFFDNKKQIFSIICGWKITLENNFDKEFIEISQEHTKSKWIRIDELNEYDFGEEKGEFIKDIILQSQTK